MRMYKCKNGHCIKKMKIFYIELISKIINMQSLGKLNYSDYLVDMMVDQVKAHTKIPKMCCKNTEKKEYVWLPNQIYKI